jgi:voltage-gated potassium channel
MHVPLPTRQPSIPRPQKSDPGMPLSEARSRHHPWVHHLLLVLTIVLVGVQQIEAANAELYSRIVFGFVLVGCMMAVYERKRLFVVGLMLGVPALVSLVFEADPSVTAASLLLGIATIGFVCVVLLMTIYDHPRITAASVSASLVVYLFLGIIWATAYFLAETSAPGSFYGLDAGGSAGTRRELFYYSFVTLTTVGYGDIGPVAPVARSLAMFLNERSSRPQEGP